MQQRARLFLALALSVVAWTFLTMPRASRRTRAPTAHKRKSLELTVDKDSSTKAFAYINLCANLRAIFPTLVLFEQLSNVNATSGDYLIIVPDELAAEHGAIFDAFGVKMLTYDAEEALFPLPYTVGSESTAKRDRMLWQKLRAWSATMYKKAIVLDNDVLIMRSFDELFQLKELAAVPQLYPGEKIAFWEPPSRDRGDFTPRVDDHAVPGFWNTLNGGLMVIEPSELAYREIVTSAQSLKNRTCCPTQEFLFRHFQKRYVRLPAIYNLRKIHKVSKSKEEHDKLLQSARMYHFVERRKPILQGRQACASDPLAAKWWEHADAVNGLLDELSAAKPELADSIMRLREAAISPELGSKQLSNM